MRQLATKVILQQAIDFYKETKYIPTNYDALFHTDHFSSPVTIRRHFGSWENYVLQAFSSMTLGYPLKMFYGGFNRHYKATLPVDIDPTFTYNGDVHDCLGKLTYKNISPSASYITTKKWEGIIEILDTMKLNYTLIPAEWRFLTPYVVINNKYAIASFDTPKMKGHYRRTSKVMEYLNKNYDLLSINGVKKNHIRSAVKRLLE